MKIEDGRISTPDDSKSPSSQSWWLATIDHMANLVLVYGMRLLPAEDIEQIGDAVIKLKNGREARVTMHVLEGSKEDIEKQFQTSTEAFFDMYPEI